MKTKEQILDQLRENLPKLQEKYPIHSLGLFGSYGQGKQQENSDVDLLVEFDETIGLMEFVHLENLLTDLLRVKVDLVIKNDLKPRIKGKILYEEIPI